MRSHLGMTIFLRRQHAQDVIEGRTPGPWKDDDYAVVDGIVLGRIYRSGRPGGEKWCWFLNGLDVVPAASLRIDQGSHGHREVGRLDRQFAMVCAPRPE